MKGCATLLTLLFAVGCASPDHPAPPARSRHEFLVVVKNIHPACPIMNPEKVRRTLGEVDGVTDVRAEGTRFHVRYDPARTSPDAVVAHLKKKGFDAGVLREETKTLRALGILALFILLTCDRAGVNTTIKGANFQLLFPLHMTVVSDPTPTFDWTDAPGSGVTYQLQVSTSAAFTTFVINVTVGASNYTPAAPLAESAKYFWRVRAIDAQGVSGGWTDAWWFIVGVTPPPAATTLIAPTNNATIAGAPEPLSVTFDWTDVAGVEYNLQVSTVPEFTSLAVNQWLTVSTYTTLLPYGTYFWRVFTVDPVTFDAAPSVTWTFFVACVPPPTLLSPPNGAYFTAPIVSFDWSDVAGAISYTIQISTSPSFVTITETATVATSAYTSSPLPDAVYYWRVRTNGGACSSPYTQPWSFEVDSASPSPPPLLISPINNAKLRDTTPTFRWTDTGSATYRIQISLSPVFTTMVEDVIVGTTSYTPATPLAVGVYYWRVKGWATETAFSLTRRLYVGVVSGDLNNDGFPEIVIGSGRYDHSGLGDAGRVVVFFGGPGLAGATTADAAPVTFLGVEAGEYFGDGIAMADVNGDLIDDLIVGGLYRDTGAGVNSGRVYIWFGGAGFPAAGTFSAATANVMIDGAAAEDHFGFQPDVLGDVNNDGYFDFGVGANFADNGATANTGAYYIFYGQSTWPAAMSATAANVIIYGQAGTDRLGFHNQGTAGDFNRDGFDDIVVASRWNDTSAVDAGRGYVVLGGSALPGVIDLAVAVAGIVFLDAEPQASGFFGYSAHKIGDVNGDGYTDIMVGSGFFDEGAVDTGKAWVFYGTPTAGGITLTAATASFRIGGSAAGTALSCGIQSSVGDVNNDGFDEVGVGEYGFNGGQGRVLIYNGSAVLGGAVTAPAGVSVTIVGEQSGNTFGTTVVPVGDVNGDGVADFAIGDYANDIGGVNVGRFYLFRGGASLAGKAGYPNLSASQADFIVTGTQVSELFSTVIGTVRY